MSGEEKTAWLVELLQHAINPVTKEIALRIRGHPVCPSSFLMYNHITEYRYYKSRKIAIGESPFLPHGNSYRFYSRPKTETVTLFLKRYIDLYCDVMPHLDEIALPPRVDRVDVWNEYIKYCEEHLLLDPSFMASLSLTLTILRTEYPNVCPRREHHLGRCDICVLYALAIENAKSEAEVLAYKALRQAHLQKMMREREYYNNLVLRAISNPKELTSYVMDHANGIRSPHIAQQPKSTNTLVRPRIEVWGLIDHGTKSKVMIPHLSMFPHDANLTITLLYNEIIRKAEMNLLSKHLHLQLDNCAKEK